MTFNVNVTYKGDMYCNVKYIPGDYSVLTSVSHDDYFSPMDLLAGALSACTVSMIASTMEGKNMNIDAKNVSMETTIKTAENNPHKILGFQAIIKIIGSKSLSDKDKQLIEAAAKSCPVKNTLSTDLTIDYDFRYE